MRCSAGTVPREVRTITGKDRRRSSGDRWRQRNNRLERKRKSVPRLDASTLFRFLAFGSAVAGLAARFIRLF